MEAAVWGDTNAGGAVQLVLRPLGELTPLPFDKKFIAQRNTLPSPPNKKTTQGLWYHSYGMDEQKGRRSFLAPGARWSLLLTARQSYYPTDVERHKATVVEAQAILEQAKAALWLLCQFGGVGSKSRRGFGCFVDLAESAGLDLERCRQIAECYRQACGLGGSTFQADRAESPSVQQILPFSDIQTFWKNYWMALDQIGDVAQRFAQEWSHNVQKKALGLPRNVRPPLRGGTFQPGSSVQRTGRHAAPVFYHLARGQDGNFVVRIAAFPAPQLPDLRTSQTFLQMLLAHFQNTLDQRVVQYRGKGPMPPVNPDSATEREDRTAEGRVKVKVLEPREQGGKVSFIVQEAGKPRGILGFGTPPATLPEINQEIEVYRNNNDLRSPQYRWDPLPAPSRLGQRGRGGPGPRKR
jgi:CRISPR-associated protein Cmr6